MEADFCVAALEDAIARYASPDIFNTDQGSQFTSFAFTNTLKDAGIRISMDGRGGWMDNVFIERLWRSLKWTPPRTSCFCRECNSLIWVSAGGGRCGIRLAFSTLMNG
jgi:transposase InsO family protein